MKIENKNNTEKSNNDMENKHKFSDKVKFHPWVGDKYEYGIKGFDENGIIVYGTKEDPGKKILIVGESHYCAKKEDAIPSITINTIGDLIDPNSEWEPYKNTYTKFIKSFTGYTDDLEFEDKKKAWEHLSFYNYVQEAMIGPRVSPTFGDFKNSEEAFWEVLNELKPDLIIIWGARLYNNLPQGGKQLEDLEVYVDKNLYRSEIWSYDIDIDNNTKCIPVLYVNHPSSGYITTFWSIVINKFIKEA